MDVRNEIAIEYHGLRDGQSVTSELCPKCKGGRTGERTLSVARDAGELVWFCHRASCGFNGRDSVRGTADAVSNNQPDKKERKLPEVTIIKDIPTEARNFLSEKYGLTSDHIADANLTWCNDYAYREDSGRLCILVYNWKGVRDGYVLRSLTGAQPKALTYVKSNSMAFYHKPAAKKVIIVEDAFSAIRLSRYCTGVALLGTHLNPSRIHDILSTKAEDYYLWLDGDAFAQAVKYALQYKGLIKLHVRKLTKDIKDCTEEELITILKEEGVIQ